MFMYISLPFTIQDSEGIKKEPNLKESIRSFLNLLVSCALKSCEADPEFGFVFNNYRFENIDESTGKFHDNHSDPSEPFHQYHQYRINGSINNVDSFAKELGKNIEKYEPRLILNSTSKDKGVITKYNEKERAVSIEINGTVRGDLSEDNGFTHKILIRIW